MLLRVLLEFVLESPVSMYEFEYEAPTSEFKLFALPESPASLL